MRAVVVTKPGQVEVVEMAPPTPGPYQARIKTHVACLCNATDGKLIAGHFPGVGLDQYPLVLGHESAGVVDQVGDKVRSFNVGDHAIGGLLFSFAEPDYSTGWGGFCEYTLVNDHDAMVADGVADEEHGWFEVAEIQQPCDSDISWADAAMLCTWREVYGGFGDFNLQPGMDMLVYGAGPVGLSFVKFGKLLGLGYIGVVEPLPQKREKALAMGADEVFDLGDPAIAKHEGKLDAVIDAVGRPDIINGALPLVKLGGSICVYGVVGDDEFVLKKGTGPYNFNLFVHQWPTRSRERAAQAPLCDWIREGKLSASEYITHEFPIEKINDAIEVVASGEAIKTLMHYG